MCLLLQKVDFCGQENAKENRLLGRNILYTDSLFILIQVQS